MNLRQLIRLLLTHKYWIILVPLFVGIVVFFLSKTLPQKYESSTVIFTNPTSDQGVNDGGTHRMDFYTSNNLFDNLTLLLKSRETLTTASLRLLSLHLYQKTPDPSILDENDLKELKKHIPESLRNSLVVTGDLEATYERILGYSKENQDSPIDYLLRDHPHYSIQEIMDNLQVSRKSSSDMMEVIYRSDKAGITYYTLKYISDAFMNRYGRIKEMENVNSIAYFENQMRLAQEKLKEAEANLKQFMTENRILNYYEQGKYLDIAKLEHEQDEERSKRIITGTRSNLEKIENLFAGFDTRQNVIRNINSLQDKIVAKNQQLQGVFLQKENAAVTSAIEQDIQELQNQIETESQKLFKSNISIEGLQRRQALDEWLQLKLQYEEQVQALDVMQERKAYLSNKIEEFAPLGAELKRLEREVDVNENQYLSILHGLNMAYLKKYDLEMTSPQKLIDEPFFPKKPLPSKRKLLVAGSLFGSGFFIVSSIIFIFLVDTRIRSAEKAQQITGLKVAGGWVDQTKLGRHVFKYQLFHRLRKQMFNHLNQYLNPEKKPHVIIVYSLMPWEGKSFMVKQLVKDIQQKGQSAIYYGPDVVENRCDIGCETFLYDTEKDIYESQNRVWRDRFSNLESDYVFIELPNFQENHVNYTLINSAHLLVQVMNAKRNWSLSHTSQMEDLRNTVTIPHVVWVNKMEEEEVEALNGEIPKRRSQIRVKVKELVS
ncbi:GumC family protein [Pleomorphovibrio marinus]|uniref:GumC family protein n=1 Tax=Pleomorphovibrio marinus TaxID=2164132 RepID=UPI000E0B81D3|nr:Wzz/FepE/Etk N-terminal domain-containing protein [Pleomorphovibrio marinus]